jgi:hypothetical protein
MQTRYFTRWKSDPPAAAWYFFIFFQNIWLSEPNVLEKNVPFRPAGGEIRFRVSDRVTPVI